MRYTALSKAQIRTLRVLYTVFKQDCPANTLDVLIGANVRVLDGLNS